MKKIIVIGIIIVLITVGLSGCEETKNEEPAENNAPTASFTFTVDHNTFIPGGTVSFDCTVTDDDEEDALTYNWDFGDGDTSIEEDPEHVYATNGSYDVSVIVSDGKDEVTVTDSILIGNQKPTADFTYIADNLIVTFTDASTDDGTIMGWSWDFGDENTSTGKNPTHQYATAGSYNVILNVFDDQAAIGVAFTEITVSEGETAVLISSILGHVTNSKIDKIEITLWMYSGLADINLGNVLIGINDSNSEVTLRYNRENYHFGFTDVWYKLPCFNLTNEQFGMFVQHDPDNSCLQNNPVMNSGDFITLTVNTTSCFDGIPPSTNVNGLIVPETGTSGIISFTTPDSYTATVITLQ